MAAPAGLCEWCGGPQRWTLIRGDIYVVCLLGCLPLWEVGVAVVKYVEEAGPGMDLAGESREGGDGEGEVL